MISFKKLLGKDEKFYDLLEASAEEARLSVELLTLKNLRPFACHISFALLKLEFELSNSPTRDAVLSFKMRKL